MKRLKLDFSQLEGTRERLEKARRRGMDEEQVQALSTFAEKLAATLNEQRDPSIVKEKGKRDKKESDLAKQVDTGVDLLSNIVARVLKHRTDTPKIIENSKLPTLPSPPTTEAPAKMDPTQIGEILQEIQDMWDNYAQTVSTSKEELPHLLAKTERILQTLQTFANINSPPSTSHSSSNSTVPTSSSTSSTSGASSSSTSHSSSSNSVSSASSSSSSQPTTSATNTTPNKTKSKLKQPTNYKDSNSTETKSSTTDKPDVKESTPKKAAATPTKANGKGKRKSMSATTDASTADVTTPSPSRNRRKTDHLRY